MDELSNILVAAITILIVVASAFFKNKKKPTNTEQENVALDIGSFSENKNSLNEKKSFLEKNQHIKTQENTEEEQAENKEKLVFDLKQAVIYNEILNRKYF